MRKRSYDTLLAAAAATVMLLISACSEDPTADNALSGSELRFEVAGAHGWQSPSPQSRAAEETTDAPEYAGVFTLQGEAPADTLFLHATVADGIESGCPDAEEPQTRATPVDKDTFYDSFGVLASAYTESWREDSCRPDYMYDVEVTKASGWATDYFWPGGQQVRFFAYAPYGGPGIALSDKSAAGTPEITYSVPSAVADQQDLCVAVTGDLTGSGNSTVPLTFGHVLTAVRFTTGDKVLAGKITKITLKNVYGKAALSMGSDSWGGYGATTDFSQTLAATVDGSAGQEITPAAATFMMLPQTLPSGASIEVVYTDDLTSTRRTLTASIAGSQWPMGRTVIYKISTTSIDITPVLNVTPPSFTYEGGEDTYTVASYVTVSRTGDVTKTVPVGWEAEFSIDDGQTWTKDKPDWLKTFTIKDSNGSTSNKSYLASAWGQDGVTDNSHTEALRNAADVNESSGQNPYNLSNAAGAQEVERTANCYVINAPGTYSLPLVYGNAIDKSKNSVSPYHNTEAYTSSASGSKVLGTFLNHKGASITQPYIYDNEDCLPAYAKLVWQDAEGLVSGVDLSDNNQSLKFAVNQGTIAQGNAVVAVYDNSDQVLWSWHIWVTDYKLGDDLKTVSYSGTHTMLPYNLGWCDGQTTTYEARSVKVRFTQDETGEQQIITVRQEAYTVSVLGNQPFYQWGRKDPMLPSTGTGNTNKTWYDASGAASTTLTAASWSTGNTTITNGILNPRTFCSNYDMDQMYYNLWAADNTSTSSDLATSTKTVYDPCPVGYKVPLNNAFRAFTTTGSNTSNASQINGTWNAAEKGWDFNCVEGTVFFPVSGYRASRSGALGSVGGYGYYWSAVPGSTFSGRNLYFHSEYVSPLTSNGRSYGFAVRPVQE
ncbi:fimbrillin family protein [Alistipes communis]|uniref:fimbrillin family protein n=1 Tax=Alistipes communis TaxID=2585118 RepID=UPI003AACF491